ncbi:LAMI_0D00496g1_1 [Lachancea mirantina]|uniref:LAMI_0D00496g1_1 n=1 Tax=Lachancea mirantina TaxID=1230905 RepID=A0A1G4J8P9_9SACH|nr:LAMI_0D00496g1_1 [Lachancea mirantina]
MSRARKIDKQLLWGAENSSGNDDGDAFHPLDEDEQDEIVDRLAVRSSVSNFRAVQILSILFLLCSGAFLMTFTKIRKLEQEEGQMKQQLLFSVISIICSLMNLRYKIVREIKVAEKIRFRITSHQINISNLILLSFLAWSAIDGSKMKLVTFLLFVPHMLFAVSCIVNSFIDKLAGELDNLRGLKYKFKSA